MVLALYPFCYLQLFSKLQFALIFPFFYFFICTKPLSLQQINDNIDYPRRKSPVKRSCETTSAIQH